MKKTKLILVVTVPLVLLQQAGFAQHGRLDSLFAKGDTTAVIDSLMKGFDEYLDSLAQPKSFFSTSMGLGNRTFSIKNNALNSQEPTFSQLSVTPGLAYYNRKGLGLGVTGFLANLNHNFHFYQYAVTPSYDYISATISAGISYTRYFGKDTTALNASPYDNDLYGYFTLHRKRWRYGISAGYATGDCTGKLTYADSVRRFNNILQQYEWVHARKTIAATTYIRDFSLTASLRKDFEWYGLFSSKDNLLFSLTTYLVTGSSKIKTNTRINYAIKKVTLSRFRKIYKTADGNGFQVQSAALSASLFYSIGRFNLLPVWFMDYYLQDTDQKFCQVFSLTFAYNF